MRTILGSSELANPNQAPANQVQLTRGNIVINQAPRREICFCSGDDLSENAYRAAKRLFMRWGHNANSIPEIGYIVSFLPGHLPRYTLAHSVARDCYNTIRAARNFHPPLTDWNFHGHEAIFVE